MKAIKVKCRIIERLHLALLTMYIMLILSVYACTAQAQVPAKSTYLGFEGTIGVRFFSLNSNIPQLSNMKVVQEGGSAGLVLGNNWMKTKLMVAGFYYSAASVPQTIDMFESEVLVNIYPLQRFRRFNSNVTPYVVSGVSMNNIKFYGHYLSDDAKINYSNIEEPYLGKITQLNASVGLGVEYRFPRLAFLHLFAEGRMSMPVQSMTKAEAFNRTSVEKLSSVTIGVSVGRKN